MFDKDLKYVAAGLLSAGEVVEFAEMARWRVAQTMKEIGHSLGVDQFEEEAGLQHLLSEGLHRGWFARVGEGVGTRIAVSEECQRVGRRLLFSLDATEASVAYCAGRMLASRLSMSSKKWYSSDSVSTNLSGKPGNRRQSVVGR